jgi:hypothetical protein
LENSDKVAQLAFMTLKVRKGAKDLGLNFDASRTPDGYLSKQTTNRKL